MGIIFYYCLLLLTLKNPRTIYNLQNVEVIYHIWLSFTLLVLLRQTSLEHHDIATLSTFLSVMASKLEFRTHDALQLFLKLAK